MKKTVLATVLLATTSFVSSVFSVPVPDYPAPNKQYIIALDGNTYFGKNKPFFQGDRPLPDGYKVVVRCYKAKESVNNFIGEFGEKWEAERQKAINATEMLPESTWEDFNKYCEEKLDMNEHKDYEPDTDFGKFIQDGYLPTFQSYWALKTPDDKIIPAMWVLDPNNKALAEIGKKNADKTPILVWPNPEYKPCEAKECPPCEAGACAKSDESSNGSSAVPQTTVEFTFSGHDAEGQPFDQQFQLVTTEEIAQSCPNGLHELAMRIEKLSPKIFATLINEMVNKGGVLSVSSVTDPVADCNNTQFKANIMFPAGTTYEQAKELAERLQKIFDKLKEATIEQAETVAKKLEEAKAAGVEIGAGEHHPANGEIVTVHDEEGNPIKVDQDGNPVVVDEHGEPVRDEAGNILVQGNLGQYKDKIEALEAKVDKLTEAVQSLVQHKVEEAKEDAAKAEEEAERAKQEAAKLETITSPQSAKVDANDERIEPDAIPMQ